MSDELGSTTASATRSGSRPRRQRSETVAWTKRSTCSDGSVALVDRKPCRGGTRAPMLVR